MTAYETAHKLVTAGYSAIPARAEIKHPAVRWKPYQSRLPFHSEIDRWNDAGLFETGLAIVTGCVAHPAPSVVVLDLDLGASRDETMRRAASMFPELRFDGPVCDTGSGGLHVYFKHPGPRVNLRNAVGLARHIDFRGDGGFVFAPPSQHPSGRGYAWWPGQSLLDCPLHPLPGWLATRLKDHGSWLKPGQAKTRARRTRPASLERRSNGDEPCRDEPVWTCTG